MHRRRDSRVPVPRAERDSVSSTFDWADPPAKIAESQHSKEQDASVDHELFVALHTIPDGDVGAIAHFVDGDRPPFETKPTLWSRSDLSKYDGLLSEKKKGRASDGELLVGIDGDGGGPEHL